MFHHLSVFVRHRASRATGFIFGISGLTFGTWAALIPFVKQKFSLDEAQLGLLLLCLPAGVLLMNPLSVPILRRFGVVPVTLGALTSAALLFTLPMLAPSLWTLGLAIFVAGAGFSAANIAMNTCASQLEQEAGVRVMSSCHGFWSAGAMLGSAMAGTATGLGVPPLWYVCGLFAFESCALWLLSGPLREVPDDRRPTDSPTEKESGFAMPNAALWSLIIISLCTNLTEGTMADWSAVYMREVVLAPEIMAGWGFAAYAFFMAAGRFMGDGLLANFGNGTMLRAGGLLASFGLLLAVLVQKPVFVLLGFACVGAGVSLGAPILYAAAARVPGMAKGAGLATMNTFAMVGFLGGPVVIGFLAKALSLPIAFAMVSAVILVWAWKAKNAESIR